MTRRIFILFTFLSISFPGYSQKGKAYTVYKTDSKIIYGICFTDRGEALGIADNNAIKVYATEGNKLLNEFKNGHKRQILAIDISKDSTLLVSGGKDSVIVFWDFISNRILKSLTFQKGIITSLQISPDKRYLVSGGTDRKVYLYDIEKNEIVHEFSDHSDDVTSVKFSPDGKLIASASGDGLINIYDVESFKLIASLNGHRSWVRDISFNREETKLISCGDDSKIITWNISNIDSIYMNESSSMGFTWLLSIDIFKDSKTYVSGGIDGKIRIVTNFGYYTTRIGKPINKIIFKPNEGSILQVALATRGKGVILINAKDMELKQ
jgi:WD40 repeat protein